jgi:hypothetical protein
MPPRARPAAYLVQAAQAAVTILTQALKLILRLRKGKRMSSKNDSTQPETPRSLQETQTQDHPEVLLRSLDRPVVPLTEAEAHYNSLVGYLKYLMTITMGAIALAISVFFFATFRDRAEMRAEMRQDLGRH